ncbi:MAG: zinc-dependent alcohol dehydrogenase family protein [Cytophagales bacterium]|nr:zinc-dependent alcohol dehydrogenase family protein [Cytophagales bacterium]
MRAAVYESFKGAISIQNVPDPKSQKDSVVIELKASGLCLSDWHGWMGHDKDIKIPHVPGHELAGVITEVGSNVNRFKIGDRVTVPFVSGCGHCPECESGNHQICDNQFQPGFTHWGSFAQFVSINYADINLVKLPDEIEFATAASLGCRFATSFRGVVDQAKTIADEWLVVHGCGGVGLSAIMIANSLGAKVIAVDIDDEKLTFAKTIGAIISVNGSTSKDVIEEIQEITNGGAHVSIDALGHPDVLLNSVSCLRKRGRHIQIGIMTPTHTNSKIPTDLIIAKELELKGSHGMQAFRYEEMLNMISDGKLMPELLISQKIGLQDVVEELPVMHEFNSVGVKMITSFS